MKHKITKLTTELNSIPFDVESIEITRNEQPLRHPYHRLKCPDWVNILPVTASGEAVLIRQFRAGSFKDILEVPGGAVDSHERDPTLAAARELEEETGYTSQRILPLASINPNPAIQNNKCHLFIALSCIENPNRQHFPDEEEDIEVVLKPVNELENLVRMGQIDHGLVALTIMLGLKYL